MTLGHHQQAKFGWNISYVGAYLHISWADRLLAPALIWPPLEICFEQLGAVSTILH